MYGEKQIYFDYDYSPGLQKKRGAVCDVIKQLKQKNIRVKCIYQVQLKIHFDTGEKTFYTLANTTPKLQEVGIKAQIDEWDTLEKEIVGCQLIEEGRRPAQDCDDAVGCRC